MKRSTDIGTEYERSIDLWHFLHCAEQLAINHEHLHDKIHARLDACLQIVSEYQDKLLLELYPDSDSITEIKQHKQRP